VSKLTQILRLLRVRSGLKNYEIAEKLGVTPATVSGHMSDLQSHVPGIEMLIKYAEIFEVPLDELIQAIKENELEPFDEEPPPEDATTPNYTDKDAAQAEYHQRVADSLKIEENPGEYLVKINRLLTILEESGDAEALRIVYRFINDISNILARKAPK
jgi:transcriptional regulator with XRE-family HTH domain